MKRGARRRVRVKSVHQCAAPEDGMRVWVERALPRSAARRGAAIDLWLREAAPSPALARWYGLDPQRWDGFRARYRRELGRRPRLVHLLEDLRRRTTVTLVFGAQDDTRTHAAVLREFIERKGELP